MTRVRMGADIPDSVVIDEFNHRWYARAEQNQMPAHWRGHRILKCPMDLVVYQEIIHETEPDIIIETGTAHGGSALFLADLCALMGRGHVFTIDPHARLPFHAPRLTHIPMSSTDPVTVRTMAQHAHGRRTMVILDSDHHEPHVSAELAAYAPLVTVGNYLIVEDTNVNGHPVVPDHGPGPMEAVAAFLPAHPEFMVDEGCEQFLATWNPGGYLRRVR